MCRNWIILAMVILICGCAGQPVDVEQYVGGGVAEGARPDVGVGSPADHEVGASAFFRSFGEEPFHGLLVEISNGEAVRLEGGSSYGFHKTTEGKWQEAEKSYQAELPVSAKDRDRLTNEVRRYILQQAGRTDITLTPWREDLPFIEYRYEAADATGSVFSCVYVTHEGCRWIFVVRETRPIKE